MFPVYLPTWNLAHFIGYYISIADYYFPLSPAVKEIAIVISGEFSPQCKDEKKISFKHVAQSRPLKFYHGRVLLTFLLYFVLDVLLQKSNETTCILSPIWKPRRQAQSDPS